MSSAISLGDDTVGQLIADAMEKVSNNGVIDENPDNVNRIGLVEGISLTADISQLICAQIMDKMEAF